MEHHTLVTTVQIKEPSKGFAMLFTVLIISLILSIAVGISNLTLRQTILSSLAKDSGIAFYQADAAVECGMFQDTQDNFPLGTTSPTDPTADPATHAKPTFKCNNIDMVIDTDVSTTDNITYIPQSLPQPNDPCFSIVFDKRARVFGGKSVVRGLGYSMCTQGPRQVQRLLQVSY